MDFANAQMSDELLDNKGITDHKAEIEIINGHSFTKNLRIAAGAFTLVGVLMILTGGPGFIIGPPILLGCIFLLTSQHGTEISLSTNYVRNFHKKLFFFKSGKWLPLNAYSDICILKIGKTRRHQDITGMVSTDIDSSEIEVYLMTHDHRKRLLLKACKSGKEAQEYANEMAEKLDKKLAAYNPQMSAKTKERLRTRK